MGDWWPLSRFSVGKEEIVELVFEERLGGRVFERLRSGAESDWGRVIAWEPSQRFVMTWHPGRSAATAQELEVRFLAEGTGTRIELTHSLWEAYGDRAETARDNYDTGWETVLGRFGVPV
jgi:hypothetical protein